MQLTRVLAYLICGLIVFILGGLAGYGISLFQSDRDEARRTHRQRIFQMRVESYEPSCSDLKSAGKPGLVKMEDDYLFIFVSEKTFVVFGFNAEPGKTPVTAWWSANRISALKQACDK